MSETHSEPAPSPSLDAVRRSRRAARLHELRTRAVPFLITLGTVALAVGFGRRMWTAYMETPWTRDGTVRTYVVTMAPEVAGRMVKVPASDNRFVRKGELLLLIDPTDYRIALQLAEAALQHAQIVAENAEREAQRRRNMSDEAVSSEERQTYAANAVAAEAQLQQAAANLDQAKVNLQRTSIRSPVNGWVTNLSARVGEYAMVGQSVISVVDADSFWVDAYFEETMLASIREGDPVTIKLMGYSETLRGQVDGVARGITVVNAQADPEGLAKVNPIFTWVRLAQRVPVRIRIHQVPEGVHLVVGMTASVHVDPRPGRPSK